MSGPLRLRMLGYWGGERTEGLDPREFLDPSWDEAERSLVADYLRDGRRWRYYLGRARCRLCGLEVGSAELCDEVYAWPEGLAHYVEVHSVRLPTAFVAHVQRETERIESREVDHTWWREAAPTGTERCWTQHVFVLDDEARARLAAVPHAVRLGDLAALARDGQRVVHTKAEARLLSAELESLGVEHSIRIERVRAPSTLLG
ncbi:MAG: hypothetical protein K1X94_19005 [Sandaracinaceae bacterium]|nr:hypothetical protein [Sandaracinaceae bacterium]